MTSRGSPESQNVGDIFVWGSLGCKVWFDNVQEFEGIHWGLPAYSYFGKENLWNIEMPDVF